MWWCRGGARPLPREAGVQIPSDVFGCKNKEMKAKCSGGFDFMCVFFLEEKGEGGGGRKRVFIFVYIFFRKPRQVG